MATFSTDFGDIPAGEEITAHGWVETWAETITTDPSAVVDATNAPVSDRWVEVAAETNTIHQNAAWKLTAAPDTSARVQVCVVISRDQSANNLLGATGRGSGSRGVDETGVSGMLRNNDTDYRFMEAVNGTLNYFDGFPHGIADPNDWIVLVLDLDGTTMRLKAWQFGDTEPVSWGITDTATVTQAGWMGLFTHLTTTGRTARWGWFSYGTEGDAAPRPVATASLDTPTGFTFTKTASTAEVTGSWSSVTDAASYDYEVEEWDGSAWQPFALSFVTAPTTTFTLAAADGVQFNTLYRSRVRAVPA